MDKYDLPVYPVVIYLNPKGAELPDCIEKVESAVTDKYIDCDTYIMCMRVFAGLKYRKR